MPESGPGTGERSTVSRPVRTFKAVSFARALTLSGAAMLLAIGAAVAQGNDPSQVGQWSATVTLPIIPIHSNLLTTGNVLIYDSVTDSTSPPRLFSPASLTSSPAIYEDNPDLFCSDSVPLTDGRIFVVGGHVAGYVGINGSTIYDPVQGIWTDTTAMAYARWYPSVVRLGDGRILVVSGAINCTDCTQPNAPHLGIADIPEIYDPQTATWSPITTASLRLPLFPHLYALPDGRVFVAASQEDPIVSQVLDLTTGTWSAVDSAHKYDGGSSVMYRPGKIMKSGSGRNPDYNPQSSAATTYVIDMTAPAPAWRQTASMANTRTQHNLVMLPDGKVLAIGGGHNSDVTDLANAVYPAEVWNPDTEMWKTLASGQVPRLYHSTALLLPDGRVFIGGGGHPGSFGIPQFDIEIYSPPYLFNGTRPSITQSPSVVPYGQSFVIQTPNAASIQSVSLIGQGTVTHGFNSNQRYVSLSFTQVAGGLSVTAPANAALAPPGYYMMSIVNGSGVPSPAAWLRLPAPWEDGQAPSAPGTLNAAPSLGRVDLSWVASSDNIGVAGYDVHRSTTSGFTPSDSNRIGQTAGTAYTDVGMDSGTYDYVVRARDAAGNVSLSSNQASATVVADTTPPSPIPGLVIVSTGPGQISLDWGGSSDDVGVMDYSIERCTGGSCANFAQIGKRTGTSFDDLGLLAGTSYSYRVRAEDARGNQGGYSDVVVGSTAAVSNGLVAAWGFNEGTGSGAADVSGFANGGAINGAGWTTQGRFGGGMSFNGGSSEVDVPDANSLDLTSGMTLEAWVKPASSSPTWKAIVDKNTDRYYLMASSDTSGYPAVGATFTSGNLNVYGAQTLPVGVWSHLAGTYDGSRLRLYLNGTQIASTAHAPSLTTSTDPLMIGADVYGEFFQGTIDEIRIYNRALSAAEIQADMTTPVQSGVVQFTLSKAPGTGAIALGWTDTAATGVYRVRRATGPAPADFATATCWVVSGTSFTDPASTTNGISYDYLVDTKGSCP